MGLDHWATSVVHLSTEGSLWALELTLPPLGIFFLSPAKNKTALLSFWYFQLSRETWAWYAQFEKLHLTLKSRLNVFSRWNFQIWPTGTSGKRSRGFFFTSNSHITYKDKLVKPNILPLSLYQELYVGLLFAKMLAGKVDIDWRSHVSITDVGNKRAQMTRNFVCKHVWRMASRISGFGFVVVLICTTNTLSVTYCLTQNAKTDF